MTPHSWLSRPVEPVTSWRTLPAYLRPVMAWLDGGTLHLQGGDVDRTYAARDVQWPERTRHGPRITRLPDGGSLQAPDAAAWDVWVREGGRSDSVVVRLQQSWRAVLVSLALLVVITAAGYVWGLPWLSREIADRLPDSVEASVGEVVLSQLDEVVDPSQLSQDEQRTIEQAWQDVLSTHRAALSARGAPLRPTRLMIRHSKAIGPNAMALPGGAMLLTDDMVRLVDHDTKVLSGVLGHELGHVQHRHGMRMLVQAGVMGLVSSLIWGDYSGLLATVPVWLGQAHYSREAERESDDYSLAVLRDAGVSPEVMVTLFERLRLFEHCGPRVIKGDDKDGGEKAAEADCQPPKAEEGKTASAGWGMGFASHPATEDRIAFFRAAAR